MRKSFLLGLAIGLVIGVVLGVLGHMATHLLGWLFIAVVFGILVVASRTARHHKFFPPPTAGR